jgi:hypothetical protein
MDDIKFIPFEDFEEQRQKGLSYVLMIKQAGALFQTRFGRGVKPIVVMSGDVLSCIARGSERDLYYNASPRVLTVCGYDIKETWGEGVLYVGIDLIGTQRTSSTTGAADGAASSDSDIIIPPEIVEMMSKSIIKGITDKIALMNWLSEEETDERNT